VSRVAHPLSTADVAEYLAGELGREDEERLEEHLYACPECARAAERMGAVTVAIREAIPPALTADRLEALRQSLRIHQTRVEAGHGAEAWFTADLDLLVHTLRADVAGAVRVALAVHGADDTLFMRVEAVPFDAQTGEVHVACQRHLRGADDVEDTRFRLVAVRGGEPHVVLGDYTIRHHWGKAV
jgi:anti-sigma factor RsiW